MDDPNKHWHLDKRVPITLILAIILQTATVIWFVAGLDKDVENLDKRTTSLEAANVSLNASISTNTTAVAVFNANMETVRRDLGEIKNAIDRVEDQVTK